MTSLMKRCKKRTCNDFCYIHESQSLSSSDIIIFNNFPKDIKYIINRKYWSEQYYKSIKKIPSYCIFRKKNIKLKSLELLNIFDSKVRIFYSLSPNIPHDVRLSAILDIIYTFKQFYKFSIQIYGLYSYRSEIDLYNDFMDDMEDIYAL
ncbi:MAG: hypothetical protein ACW98D_20800 [Promethearchaeota archaeon]